MRFRDIEPKKLVVFDIDDTLVHTQTKVHVVKDDKVVKSLNSHDFTHYKLQPDEKFDFEDFKNARDFFDNHKPIIPMMNQLKRDIATGNKVVMVTARSDFDDKELFLDTFRKYGVDTNKVHVYRAGNIKNGSTEQRKKTIIKTLLDKGNYTKAIMYDDAKPNLHSFMELKKDHPRTRFYAWLVSLDGEASEYMREDLVSERKKKRKKNKTKRTYGAVWGPGPYGLYGWDAGYSGSGGVSSGDGGGGVGEDIEEGWKDWVAGAALGAAALTASPDVTAKVDAKPSAIQQVNKKDISKTVTGSPHEVVLKKYAERAGIKGQELAAFLAQCAHETMDFKHMKEIGGSLDFRKYDPKYAPKKAKALGNKVVGDGAKFKGRGYIQLTGRYNYKRAGEALGLPLEKQPELVEKPEVAAKVAVWYWQNRVAPKVDTFKDVKAVTKPINPGMKHLDQRKEKHQAFQVAMK